MRWVRWLMLACLAGLCGCGSVQNATMTVPPAPEQLIGSPEAALDAKLQQDNLLDATIYAGKEVLGGVLYPVLNNVESLPLFGYVYVEPIAGRWSAGSSSFLSSDQPLIVGNEYLIYESGKLVRFGLNPPEERALVFGFVRSPEVKAVLVTFDSGEQVREDIGEASVFVALASQAGVACELHVLGAGDQLLKIVAPPSLGSKAPPASCA